MAILRFLFRDLSGRRSRATAVVQQRSRLFLDDNQPIIYAIGDVHGCLDLLLKLETLIIADAAAHRDRSKLIIMLGDFIDRGTKSAEVVDHLIVQPPADFDRYTLAGNHEEAMLRYLDNTGVEADEWLQIGGLETLASYGVSVGTRMDNRRERARARLAARVAIPIEHIDFLRKLPVGIACGKYLFVHAGVLPKVPLGEQSDRDLTEIRDEFTTSGEDHGYIVVHGHTPLASPMRFANRVSLDVASYATGRLAAACIYGEDISFIVAK